MFDGDGKVLWRYKPTGKDALDHPSLAEVLPNGMVIANDDSNHRVIVVDPKTNRIVWQYGRDREEGTRARPAQHPGRRGPGAALLAAHAHMKTMGTP